MTPASSGVIDALGYACGAIVIDAIGSTAIGDALPGITLWIGAGTLVVAVCYWLAEEQRRERPR